MTCGPLVLVGTIWLASIAGFVVGAIWAGRDRLDDVNAAWNHGYAAGWAARDRRAERDGEGGQ